jgi:hypothetical protein
MLPAKKSKEKRIEATYNTEVRGYIVETKSQKAIVRKIAAVLNLLQS